MAIWCRRLHVPNGATLNATRAPIAWLATAKIVRAVIVLNCMLFVVFLLGFALLERWGVKVKVEGFYTSIPPQKIGDNSVG